ncbi:MAG: transporter [Burkholderiales bacterium]
MNRPVASIAAFALAAACAASALAEPAAEELAKLAQNPIANLVSVPFQNNTNLNFGPQKATQNTLNIQPVIPFEITKDWNVITRTIVPVMSQPALGAGDERTNGIGETQFSAFLSPSATSGTVWGVGPIVQLPTTSSSALGSYRWGLGPTVVILRLEKGNPWVYGFLANNVWSVGSGAGAAYNNFLLQPFLNYNFRGGTYLTTSPIVTANWKADGQQWTVPIGGGIGHIFRLDKLPVNAQVGAYYNVVRPDLGPNWQVRAQVQLMFPK